MIPEVEILEKSLVELLDEIKVKFLENQMRLSGTSGKFLNRSSEEIPGRTPEENSVGATGGIPDGCCGKISWNV